MRMRVRKHKAVWTGIVACLCKNIKGKISFLGPVIVIGDCGGHTQRTLFSEYSLSQEHRIWEVSYTWSVRTSSAIPDPSIFCC